METDGLRCGKRMMVMYALEMVGMRFAMILK
jgi:hypothetical protein